MPPKGSAIIFPIHGPDVAAPIIFVLSIAGVQCTNKLDSAGHRAPYRILN